MCEWNAVCRRFVAVVLMILGLIVLPSVPAFATGDSGGAEAEAPREEAGAVEQVIDWLVELFSGPKEGETGPDFDPNG